MRLWTFKNIFFILVMASAAVVAQNRPNRLPPPGIAVPGAVRSELEASLRELQTDIKRITNQPTSDQQHYLLPDALVYEKAVRYALEHNEFYRTNEFAIARKLIKEGRRRIAAIAKHSAPWTTSTGFTVRGYTSKIDGSVQPFGLVIPPGYKPGNGKSYRLDVWLHGRDDTLTELKFINERSTKPGEFTPLDTFVLHPYGRYCNAFKFAGEVDVFEAIEHLQLELPIDRSRIALRGFSMGGAGVWHLAAHHAYKWVCAAPGAGFAETAQYLRLQSNNLPWYERTLWQWYDATDYAANLFNLPLIAYSGELDKQKQAADIMEHYMAEEGLPLIHLIGPKTEHKYEPETKKMRSTIVDTFARVPRNPIPNEVRLTTRTLRYPRMNWLVLTGLEKHWERADAWARIAPGSLRRITLSLTNVTSFALDFQDSDKKINEVAVNGTTLRLPARQATNLLFVTHKSGTWEFGTWPGRMQKQPGLQGPIDDAFMDSFIFVTPSRSGFHESTSQWVNGELKRARFEWRAQFRGEAPEVADTALQDWQIKRSNLILWGDPESNLILKRILPQLPLKWDTDRLQLGKEIWSSKDHLPLLIFPNPLNPEKYVVLNSCFTFRGFGSNASQTPKLPDYAVLDLTKTDPFKEGVVAAGFFNEFWALE